MLVDFTIVAALDFVHKYVDLERVKDLCGGDVVNFQTISKPCLMLERPFDFTWSKEGCEFG